MAEPTITEEQLRWAENDITDPIAEQDNKVEPNSSHKDDGWAYPEKPPFNWFNFWMNGIWQWLKHIIDDVLKGTYTFLGNKTFSGNVTFEEEITFDEPIVGEFKNEYPAFWFGKIGNDTALSVDSPCIAVLTPTRIVISQAYTATPNFQAYDFNGLTWTAVGSSFSTSGVQQVGMCALNSTTIAYVSAAGDLLTTYSFNGSTWSQVGSQLAITNPGGGYCLTLIDSNTIALSAAVGSGGYLRTYYWNGTNWAQVGNSLSLTVNTGITTSCALGLNLIAYMDILEKDLRTYSWDGTNWTLVGNELNISGASVVVKITSLSDKYIVYADYTNNALRTYYWSGTNWSLVGAAFVITLSPGGTPTMGTLTNSTIVYIDSNTNQLRTYGLIWQNLLPRITF